MKRHADLQDLSRDHHHALVLARRAAAAAAEPGEAARVWPSVVQAFEVELEPHFRVEEELLLAPLASAQEHELVQRTQADHARIRELIAGEASQQALAELGELLRAHVRFEESELFPTAEAKLDASQLAAAAAASAALETARRRSKEV